MKKVLSSFVIISNSLDAGKDSIDAFIPFVIRLFDVKNYHNVNIETICKDFVEEYGIQIPRYPMETILNRMKPQYLVKGFGKITINRGEVRKYTQTIDFEKEARKYNWLLGNFIDFCKNFSTPLSVSYEEADSLFINFLKDHDLDIIFAAYLDEKMSILPNGLQVEDPDKIYLLNRYVNLLLQRGGEYSEYLIDSAVGHKYASLLLYREFSNIRGKGACANYYLDVGILFDLTGINKAFRKKALEDLLSMLRDKGSSLWVFRHTYEEFLRIVEGCLNWIENNYYDPAKANRTLQYFMDEGYGVAEVLFFISQIDNILEKNKIQITNTPDPNVDQVYQIGRAELQKTILEVYNSSGYSFDLDDKEDTLERDEVSIESVYKLRKGNVPINLNIASHVFVTTNPGLAYASARFEQDILRRGYFTIPTVLTDTFIGTVIWAGEPTGLVKEFNRSKLISYTNAMIQPRANLMSRFAQEVERAKNNQGNPISDESAYLLLTSSLPRKLLADKTLGNPNRITAQTPYEMLNELEKSLTTEEREKTEAALREAESNRISKEHIEGKLRFQTENINRLIRTAALWIKRIVVVFLIIIALITFAISEFQESKTMLVKIVEYLLSVLSLFSGITIFLLGERIENWIRQKLTILLITSKNV